MMDNEGLYTNDDIKKNDSWDWETRKRKRGLNIRMALIKSEVKKLIQHYLED